MSSDENNNEQIKAFLVKSEKMSHELQRNWIVQAITGALGLLYILDPDRAGGVANLLKIDLSLTTMAVPLMTFYLFGRMGFIFDDYLTLRSALLHFIIEKKIGVEKENFLLTVRDVSLYGLLSFITQEQFIIGDDATNIQSKGLLFIPVFLLGVLHASVFSVSIGVSIYLTYTFFGLSMLAGVLTWIFFMSLYGLFIAGQWTHMFAKKRTLTLPLLMIVLTTSLPFFLASKDQRIQKNTSSASFLTTSDTNHCFARVPGIDCWNVSPSSMHGRGQRGVDRL